MPSTKADSFQTKKQATPTLQPVATEPTKKGVSVVGTMLIALASLGLGVGAVLTARHLNWFELGQKVDTKVTEKIPTAVADALNLGKDATEKTTTQAIEGLWVEMREKETALQTARETLQTSLTEKRTIEAQVANLTEQLTNAQITGGETVTLKIQKTVLEQRVAALQQEILDLTYPSEAVLDAQLLNQQVARLQNENQQALNKLGEVVPTIEVGSTMHEPNLSLAATNAAERIKYLNEQVLTLEGQIDTLEPAGSRTISLKTSGSGELSIKPPAIPPVVASSVEQLTPLVPREDAFERLPDYNEHKIRDAVKDIAEIGRSTKDANVNYPKTPEEFLSIQAVLLEQLHEANSLVEKKAWYNPKNYEFTPESLKACEKRKGHLKNLKNTLRTYIGISPTYKLSQADSAEFLTVARHNQLLIELAWMYDVSDPRKTVADETLRTLSYQVTQAIVELTKEYKNEDIINLVKGNPLTNSHHVISPSMYDPDSLALPLLNKGLPSFDFNFQQKAVDVVMDKLMDKLKDKEVDKLATAEEKKYVQDVLPHLQRYYDDLAGSTQNKKEQATALYQKEVLHLYDAVLQQSNNTLTEEKLQLLLEASFERMNEPAFDMSNITTFAFDTLDICALYAKIANSILDTSVGQTKYMRDIMPAQTGNITRETHIPSLLNQIKAQQAIDICMRIADRVKGKEAVTQAEKARVGEELPKLIEYFSNLATVDENNPNVKQLGTIVSGQLQAYQLLISVPPEELEFYERPTIEAFSKALTPIIKRIWSDPDISKRISDHKAKYVRANSSYDGKAMFTGNNREPLADMIRELMDLKATFIDDRGGVNWTAYQHDSDRAHEAAFYGANCGENQIISYKLKP